MPGEWRVCSLLASYHETASCWKQGSPTIKSQTNTLPHYYPIVAKDPARTPSKRLQSTCSTVGVSPLSKRVARPCDSETFLFTDAAEVPLVSPARESRGPGAASLRVAARRPLPSCAATTSPLSRLRAGDARLGSLRLAPMPEFTPVSVPYDSP